MLIRSRCLLASPFWWKKSWDKKRKNVEIFVFKCYNISCNEVYISHGGQIFSKHLNLNAWNWHHPLENLFQSDGIEGGIDINIDKRILHTSLSILQIIIYILIIIYNLLYKSLCHRISIYRHTLQPFKQSLQIVGRPH